MIYVDSPTAIYICTCLDQKLIHVFRWAGKEFFRDQKVGDRVGRNEKTKIIVKLQKPGSGPPVKADLRAFDQTCRIIKMNIHICMPPYVDVDYL